MNYTEIILTNNYRPVWKWNNEDNKEQFPTKLSTLVVIDGLNALNIINLPILKKKAPICELDGAKISIYDFPELDLAICVSEEKDLNLFSVSTDLIQNWLDKADKVIGISIQSKSEFKGVDRDSMDACFTRALRSSLKDVKPLEEPNFITGVVAGASTYRNFKNLPFSCYIFYVEIFDVLSIKFILNFLKRLDLPYDDKVTIRALHQKSDLYM